MRLVRLVMICLCGISVSACALNEQLQNITASISQSKAKVQNKHEQFQHAIQDSLARKAAQEVDRPWLAGKAQPLARELTLPAALRANVQTTLMFADGPLDLASIAQRIMKVTGIP